MFPMNKPTGHFLLDTNIYRTLSFGLDEATLNKKTEEMREKETRFNYGSICSVVVCLELISHLADTDPAREHCYKALYLLNHHTKPQNGKNRLVAYPFENILTRFFLCRNY